MQQRNVFAGTSGYSPTQLCPNLLRNEDGCTNARGVFMDGDSLPKVCIGAGGAGGCDCLWLGGVIERHSECDRCVWRMSEELERLDGNSTLLLVAVWVHLCMHVCGFGFFH